MEVLPALSPARMREELSRARVAVLPSRAEAMPMFLLEAMAAGRPFVSTPVGAVPELARHGGVLVPCDDVDALAAGLVKLLSQPRLAAELGARGREFCRRELASAELDAQLRELYERTAATIAGRGIAAVSS
jgi:glycosyltransferase involved in cell wall biosynthesis